MDDSFGIPVQVFRGTLERMDDLTLLKFRRRMCGSGIYMDSCVDRHVGQDISAGEPDCGMAVVGYARDNGRRRTLFGKFFPDGSGMHAGQR